MYICICRKHCYYIEWKNELFSLSNSPAAPALSNANPSEFIWFLKERIFLVYTAYNPYEGSNGAETLQMHHKPYNAFEEKKREGKVQQCN